MAERLRTLKPVVFRRAGPDDVDAILTLNRVGNGEDIAVLMDVVFRHGGMAPEDYAVAVSDGRVVATAGLLTASLRLDSVVLPVGQPEFIATDPEYQGHGLARRLLQMVHDWSATRHDLVQVVAGVPYFYRQHGYTYGLVKPVAIEVPPEHRVGWPEGWMVRPADTGDIGRIRELQALAQGQADVALPFTDNLWPSFLHTTAAPLLVGIRDGRVEAVARLRVKPGVPVQVQALAVSNGAVLAGVRAILADAQARYPDATLVVVEREGSPVRAVAPASARPAGRRAWLYPRVPSLPRLLSVLVPVLDERLARSCFAEESLDMTISLYRESVGLRIERGRVAAVSSGPGVHEPGDTGDVGIPPDLVGAAPVRRRRGGGARELSRRLPEPVPASHDRPLPAAHGRPLDVVIDWCRPAGVTERTALLRSLCTVERTFQVFEDRSRVVGIASRQPDRTAIHADIGKLVVTVFEIGKQGALLHECLWGAKVGGHVGHL